MGTQGSLKYYENRDPGPHFSMKMGTRGPQIGGSLFLYDIGSTLEEGEGLLGLGGRGGSGFSVS